MLAPLTGTPKAREILTYDLEWWPGTYELRMCGAFDTKRGYRFYRTIAAFIRGELTWRTSRMRFYAHFGGTSDMIFLLQHIIEHCPEIEATAIFAGSSAVIVRLRRGERSWTFVDSGFLIRRPLADVGEWLGYDVSSKRSKNYIASENFEEVRDQNEQDCVMLHGAIVRLQEQLNAHGGELRPTLASCALDLFRRRYLKRTIPTHPALNVLARRAYIASRVEPFQRHCPQGEYYDVNSSFPWSMSHPQPAEVANMGRILPCPERKCFLADVEVNVPKSTYLPPVGYRHDDGRILFPTGRWRAVLDSADIWALQEMSGGGAIEKVHEVTTFETFDDLAEYVADIYERKANATGYEREVWKLLLNALYGKFAERSEKHEIVIRPESTRCSHDPPCSEENPCITLIAPDVWAVRKEVEVAHAHVPIAAHVTAMSRKLLYDGMRKCSDLYYCDTDSIVCGPDVRLQTSPALGDLKHEYTIRDGTFLAPKLYSFEKPDGARVVRAKGFSRLDYGGFCDLAEGREVTITRMQRIREGLHHDGRVSPKDVTVEKKVYLKDHKRRFASDGSSVPWDVSELQAE